MYKKIISESFYVSSGTILRDEYRKIYQTFEEFIRNNDIKSDEYSTIYIQDIGQLNLALKQANKLLRNNYVLRRELYVQIPEEKTPYTVKQVKSPSETWVSSGMIISEDGIETTYDLTIEGYEVRFGFRNKLGY